MQSTHRQLQRGHFISWFHQLIPGRAVRALWRTCHPTARRARKLAGEHCATALVYHGLRRQGSLRDHVKELFGIAISDAALTQRRARLPWEIFWQLMELALRPLAQPRWHKAAFAKIGMVVLTELGMHNPLAAAIGRTRAGRRCCG